MPPATAGAHSNVFNHEALIVAFAVMNAVRQVVVHHAGSAVPAVAMSTTVSIAVAPTTFAGRLNEAQATSPLTFYVQADVLFWTPPSANALFQRRLRPAAFAVTAVSVSSAAQNRETFFMMSLRRCT